MDTHPPSTTSPQKDKHQFAYLGHPMLLSINEASYMSGLSRSKIYRMMDAGLLASRKIGKRRLIPREALEQLAAPAPVEEACA